MSLGRLCALAIAVQLFFGAAAWAQAPASDTMNDYLKNLREIGIDVDVSGRPECIQPESSLRATIINRIVPAGFVVSADAPQRLSLTISNIHLTGQNICATALSFEFAVGQFINTPLDRIRFVTVVLWGGTTVQTSSPSGSKNFLDERIIRSTDLFLSIWRTVNAGADFVRQQPPASPPPSSTASPVPGPNIRTVQQRLQTLGLYQGIIDGLAGPGTRQAVQVFQRSVQLPATGDLDVETMRRLFP